jgi:hypothetical protein
VTCIKGHPCLIFYSPTNNEEDYEYIGKYNLNLDKGTHEPFGFMNDDEDLSDLDKIMEKPDPNDEQALANWKKAKFGYLLTEDGELDIRNGVKQNAIYCFEFLDNAVKVCNFLAEDEALSAEVPEDQQETFYRPYVEIDNDDYLEEYKKEENRKKI